MLAPLRWITFPILLLSSPALAQEPAAATPPAQAQPEPEVLVGPGTPMGGWGGPTFAFGEVNGQSAMFVGGRGGWLIARRFTIGGAGAGLVNEVDAPPAGDIPRQLQMAYGGLWLESAFDPLGIVHLTAGLLAGGGGVDLTPQGQDYSVENDGFFVLEPTLCVELNVGRTIRADLGVTYRWVNGIDLAGLDDGDLSGPTALVVLKFGSF